MNKFKEFILSEDLKILPTIALCCGIMGSFLIVIVFLGSMINGDYYGQLLPTALWFIAFACGIWVLHVVIDFFIEDNERRKRMNEAIANDPVLNNSSIDFVDDDRYADWEIYHRGQSNNGK